LGVRRLDGAKRPDWNAIGTQLAVVCRSRFRELRAKTAAVSCVCAAVLRDADRGTWCAAAVRAFAIVTGARPSRRVFLHDSAESTAITSLVVAFRAVSFLKLKFRIAALDFKRSG
jgi:hypothetical protein